MERRLYKDKNLLILFCITLVGVMGVASIAPAHPEIAKHFGIEKNQVDLLIIVFTLPGIFLAPVLGYLSDKIGRKVIMVPSLFLFSIAGTICAYLNDFNYLLIARTLQGIGGAAITSINYTMIGDIFKGQERVKAMGYNGGVLNIGTTTYPLLGGALALIAWNYPFMLTILGLPVGLLVLFMLDNPEPQGEYNLFSYIRQAWKHLNKGSVYTLLLASILSFIVLYGAVIARFPFLLEQRFGFNPLFIGLTISLMSVASGLIAILLGKITLLISKKNLLIISYILYIISFICFIFIYNVWLFLIPVLIFGLANGLIFPIIQVYLVELAPFEYRGIFMSLNGMVLRIGQTVGPPILYVLYMIGDYSLLFIGSAIITAILILAIKLFLK